MEKLEKNLQEKEKNKNKNTSKSDIENNEKEIIQNTAENKEKNTDIITAPKSKKKIIIISVIISIFILLILTLCTIFSIIAKNSNKIISGIAINGINVSKLTKDEAIEKLNKDLSPKMPKKIILKHNDYSYELDVASIEASYDTKTIATEAYNIGRTEKNIFANNFKIIGIFFVKKDLNASIVYNSNLLNEKIDLINDELPDRVMDSSYEIQDNNLIVSNSTNGYKVNHTSLENLIVEALKNNNTDIEIPVEEYQADKVDIDAIYNAIRKDPVDATFSSDPYELRKEINGLDFAISIEEARKIVSEEKESYTIPLKILIPKVTVKTLPSEAFPDVLATYSTTYASSNYNRSTNIALATKSINGYVLMPGESFSYNTVVGQRTPARGYKEAGVYVNGTVSTDYGGGICQVSSTLYNSVLLTNLEIVQRTNHTFEPSYVPAGQDATVSWTSPDFIFKNNRKYPIKIVASAGNGRISVNICGVKSDDDYVVKIHSEKTGTIPFTTEYRNDNSMPTGTTKVIQAGSNGCKSQTYQILYKDGVEVSRKLINSDTYKPHNQVVLRGTGAIPAPVDPPTPPQENNTAPTETTPDTSTPSTDSSVTITTNVPQ